MRSLWSILCLLSVMSTLACQTPMVESPPTHDASTGLSDVSQRSVDLMDASDSDVVVPDLGRDATSTPDRDNRPQSWDGYVDPDYIPVIEDSTPEDVPVEVQTVFTCLDLCELQGSLGCTLGPSDLDACFEWCGDVEVGPCSTALDAVVTCVGGTSNALCDRAGEFRSPGCEADRDALTACLSLPPPDCASLCHAELEAGCWFGPAELEACTAACEQLGASSCAASHANWLACVGHVPDVSCGTTGEARVEGCASELDQLTSCEDALILSCPDLCGLYDEVSCDNQPPLATCQAACIVEEGGPCEAELQALVLCAESGPAVLCHPVTGLPAPAGCDVPLAALDACRLEHP